MVTMSEVAKKCGVSLMTVSRVINNSGSVKKETQERILKAIEELNYIPNMQARSITGSPTRTLALLIPDVENSFYTSVCRGVEDVAWRKNYTLIVCNHDDIQNKEYEYIRNLISLRVDGLLMIPSGDNSIKNIDFVKKHSRPVVIIDRKPSNYNGDFVAGDSFQGSIELVNHLISLSHRRIAMLNGSMDICTARDRLDGYKKALENHGIEFDDNLVYIGKTFNEATSIKGMKKFLSLDSPPTAIFAANNFIAAGVIKFLRTIDMDVPNDLALVCFDDFVFSEIFRPSITMVKQPAYDFGALASEILINRLEGVAEGRFNKLILKPDLIIGDSTEKYIF